MSYPGPHAVTPESFERFGDLLRYLRLRARLTQRELSIAVGYNFAQISRLESGQRLPDPAVVAAVFVPALDLADEPAWAARLLALAEGAARRALDRSLVAAREAAAEPAQVGQQAPAAPAAPAPADLPLLRTKLYVPQVRPDVVLRPRLLRQLDAALTAPLTLVAAGAGFGKTTLVSQWLTRIENRELNIEKAEQEAKLSSFPILNSPLKTAWLSLDASDNDPATFLRYLVAALQALLPGAGNTTLTLLQLPQPPPLPLLLTPLLNDLTSLPGPSLLVLDDYHLLTAPAIHDALLFLVDHLPPALHVIIAGRVDPPLPLARLRARGALVELRAADLRFTPDESYALLHDAMGAAVTPEEAGRLEARTEGWAVGLQLAALALRGRQDYSGFLDAFTGSNRYVADYLAAEVLGQLPAHLRTFVLQTSILERLCGPLCDTVLGIEHREGRIEEARQEALPSLFSIHHSQFEQSSYSRLVLAELDQAQLFVVPLDSERRWYRYHHLFAEMLRSRLQDGAGRAEVDLLHRRAARWYEQQGLLAEAVGHALAGHDWVRAAEVIETHGLPLLVRGQLHTVLSWLEALPAAVLQGRPLLCHGFAVGLMLTSRFAAARALLDSAERHLPPDLPDDLAGLIHARLIGLRGHIAFMAGDVEQAAGLYEGLMARLPETAASPPVQQMLDLTRSAIDVYGVAMVYSATGDVGAPMERRAEAGIGAAQRSGNHAAVLNGCTYLASIQRLQGRLRAAAATYARFEELAPSREALEAGFGTPAYYVGVGELQGERDDLDAAERSLTRALAHIQGTLATDAEVILRGHLALARVHQARGSAVAALATIDGFRQLARERQLFPLLLERAAAAEARLHMMQGQLDAALAWAAASRVGPDSPLSFPREAIFMTLARVQIAAGAAAQATPLLARLLVAAEARGRGHSAVEILALQALAAEATGAGADSLALLGRALARAEPEGYVRLFVDEGDPMARLLDRLGRQPAAAKLRPYVERLLACSWPATPSRL